MDPNLKIEDWAGRFVDVLIDRPIGSAHPSEADIVYGVNYGHVAGTLAPDGQPLDVYVLGTERVIESCIAGLIAIVRRNDDIEDKLVVALAGDWDEASIMAAVRFQEQFFDSWVEMAPLPEDSDRDLKGPR